MIGAPKLANHFPTTNDTAGTMSQEHLGAFTQSAAGCRTFLWIPNPRKIGRCASPKVQVPVWKLEKV